MSRRLEKIITLVFIFSLITGCSQTTATPVYRTPTVLPSLFTLEPISTAIPPEPTINYEYLADTILTVLIPDSDCVLPCLWDIEPCETLGRDALEELESFSESALFTSLTDSEGQVIFRIPTDAVDKFVELSFTYYTNTTGYIDEISLSFVVTQLVDDGYVYAYSQELTSGWMESYLPGQLIRQYGLPDEVLFYTERDYRSDTIEIVFVYENEGFIIHYFAPKRELEGLLEACIDESHVAILTWIPGQENPEAVALHQTVGDGSNITLYVPLESATEISIDELWVMADDPTSRFCFQTDLDFGW